MELVGKYCKDCKVFTDNVDENALELIYSYLLKPIINIKSE